MNGRPLHHLSHRLKVPEICEPLLDLSLFLLRVVKVVSVSQVIVEPCESRSQNRLWRCDDRILIKQFRENPTVDIFGNVNPEQVKYGRRDIE